MIKRIIEISKPSYLKVKNSQLCILQNGEQKGEIPIEDIGVLLLSHPEILITSFVTSRLIANKAALIHCDERYMPCAYTLPLDNNITHSAILKTQINTKETLKKRIWKQIVKAKIRSQAELMAHYFINEAKSLFNMVERVKSGDTENKEAQAAQYYWRRLFDNNFRRNKDDEGVNSLLNYGYAIIRACLTRAICSAGLHPALGIHHSNKYNAFCLADDLMEPLRPLTDWQVKKILHDVEDKNPNLNQEIKKQLLSQANKHVLINKRQLPLMVAMHEYVASFKRILQGEQQKVDIPVIKFI